AMLSRLVAVSREWLVVSSVASYMRRRLSSTVLAHTSLAITMRRPPNSTAHVGYTQKAISPNAARSPFSWNANGSMVRRHCGLGGLGASLMDTDLHRALLTNPAK